MQNYLILLITTFLCGCPAMAHEGSNADHLAMGMGIGEVIGLVTGLLMGAGSVLLFVNYRNRKSK